ncbi:Uncharacterized protein OBRU01_16743 [Operophtera brumata]|uniref:Uncharacterized protein n=1 Tax=Operophtera brumata TaxID=104452 RepID=A0A0L7L2E0_OPEBR|nr:Uncharacterized protein OBRU01_16743 [Operophtera brumata]
MGGGRECTIALHDALPRDALPTVRHCTMLCRPCGIARCSADRAALHDALPTVRHCTMLCRPCGIARCSADRTALHDALPTVRHCTMLCRSHGIARCSADLSYTKFLRTLFIMDNNDQTKKCFCARCFMPIDSEDKTHVVSRFRGETPVIHSNSWWMQWAPGFRPQESCNSDYKDESKTSGNRSVPEEPEKKKFFCSRCLHPVDESEKVVFCEQCFHEHVLNRQKAGPDTFFKNCFESWQNNAQFAENMRTFMGGSKDSTPLVFMMQGQQPPFCTCGVHNEDAKNPATPGTVSIADETSTWELSFENRTEFSDIPESCNAIEEQDHPAAEKIEKLTKYLHVSDEKSLKKWKNFELEKSDQISVETSVEFDIVNQISVKNCVELEKLDQTSVENSSDVASCWVDLQNNAISSASPKCLWQCGPIYVASKLLKRDENTVNVPFHAVGLFPLHGKIFNKPTLIQVSPIFDIYCLYMAAPGSSHTGYYVISYQFVYVGSPPTFLFFAIVNDLIFSYNVLIVLIWSVVCVAGCYGWVLVYSLYLELSDLTKLEDLAHLRVSPFAFYTIMAATNTGLDELFK